MTNELMDKIKSEFVSNAEFEELKKAMIDSAVTDEIRKIDYSPGVQNQIFQEAPLYAYLKSKSREITSTSGKVGYRKYTKKGSSTFINENDDIPTNAAPEYTKETDEMKIIVYKIELGDLAQAGVDSVNVKTKELESAFADISTNIERTILHGEGTAATKDWKGITNMGGVNTINAADAELDEEMLDVAAQDIIDNGGTPTCVIATANAGRQVKNVLKPYLRANMMNSAELHAGYTVPTYETPKGNKAPIIVTSNIDNTNGEKIIMLDENTVDIRPFLTPTLIPLARVKLASNDVVASFTTSYNTFEAKNSVIDNLATI